MKRIAHKTALHALGWLCIVLGIVGCVLPLIPGIPLFVLGIYFVSLGWLWLWIKLESMHTRFPTFSRYFILFDKKMSRFIKKAHY